MELEALLLAFSENTGIYAFMTSPWGWPIAESLHFIGLCLLIGTIGLFDLRMLGFASSIPLGALHRVIPFGVVGYALNVATGTMFLTTAPDQYVYNPAFQTKLLFMAVAGVNMLLFYRLAFNGLRSLRPDQGTPGSARVFALVSLLAWVGVITCGRLITFYRPPYFWCFWC